MFRQFWSTHGGAELDLVFMHKGKRLGFELTFTEAPKITASMRTAKMDLRLDRLYVVHPGAHGFPMDEGITAVPLTGIQDLCGDSSCLRPCG